MPQYANYHSHSHYCDGKGTLADYVQAAIEKGLRSFGFSGHAPMPFPSEWNMPYHRFPSYVYEARQLQQAHAHEIDLLVGMEIDYIAGVTDPLALAAEADLLDYTIGSTHYVGSFPNGRHWEVDGPHQKFLRGLQEIYQGDMAQVVRDYFALTREMVENTRPDVVGHIDKLKIQFEGGQLFSESDPLYKQELMATLETIRGLGLAVEANTRGIYKKYAEETYPSAWVLSAMLDMGIAVQVNSDCHHPREIDACFNETYTLLSELGFRSLRAFHQGHAADLPFDAQGIYWD